jgi:DNA-binding GntR family transcriptional regulator
MRFIVSLHWSSTLLKDSPVHGRAQTPTPWDGNAFRAGRDKRVGPLTPTSQSRRLRQALRCAETWRILRCTSLIVWLATRCTMTTQKPRSSRTAKRPAAPSAGPPFVSPYEKLKQAILSGELAPHQALVEVSLAKWCGVSRTPIREALRRLEQDGLIYRDMHGLRVRERSPEEILDLYDTRIVLEAAAAGVASERRTDHDVRLLRWSLQHGKEISSDDVDAMVEGNQQFHRAIWQATRNESLIDLLERLNLHLARYPGTTLSFPGRWADALREHEQLTDAIEGRNAHEAQEIARRHFAAARDIRLSLFAQERFPRKR